MHVYPPLFIDLDPIKFVRDPTQYDSKRHDVAQRYATGDQRFPAGGEGCPPRAQQVQEVDRRLRPSSRPGTKFDLTAILLLSSTIFLLSAFRHCRPLCGLFRRHYCDGGSSVENSSRQADTFTANTAVLLAVLE